MEEFDVSVPDHCLSSTFQGLCVHYFTYIYVIIYVLSCSSSLNKRLIKLSIVRVTHPNVSSNCLNPLET